MQAFPASVEVILLIIIDYRQKCKSNLSRQEIAEGIQGG
jgi:hypothetical protein